MGEHQQENARDDGCIAGIDQPRLTVPVDGTAQQDTGGDGGQRDEDE